jgi:hypothetical protein
MKITAQFEAPEMYCEKSDRFKEHIKHSLVELLGREIIKKVEPKGEPIKSAPLPQEYMVRFQSVLYVYTEEEMKAIVAMINAIDSETCGIYPGMKDLKAKILG